MTSLESKKKYYDSVKRSNFQASLRLQSKEPNKMTNLTFGQWCNELVLMFKVREGFTGDQARRFVLDELDYFFEVFEEGLSVQEAYQIEVDRWTDNNV